MNECPFLSTFEEGVKCFKDCALYNYNENGGICPFRILSECCENDLDRTYYGHSYNNREVDLEFIEEYYLKKELEYL